MIHVLVYLAYIVNYIILCNNGIQEEKGADVCSLGRRGLFTLERCFQQIGQTLCKIKLFLAKQKGTFLGFRN